jgi:hypothetical protein
MTITELKTIAVPILKNHDVLGAHLYAAYYPDQILNTEDGNEPEILITLPPGKNMLDLVNLNLELEETLGLSLIVYTYALFKPEEYDTPPNLVKLL